MEHTSEQTPLLAGGTDSNSNALDAYLTRFRQAIGINATIPTPSPPHDLESARRSATGIYKETIQAQITRRMQYNLVEVIFYAALLSNIIIGATLASLGSLNVLHPSAITILGIINSSMAGILALLKGQGLPDRFKKDQWEMQKVQDFIEEVETRLTFGVMGSPDGGDGGAPVGEKILDSLVREVFQRYDVARDTAQMNKPANYVHQIDLRPAGGDGGDDRRQDNRSGVVAGGPTGGDSQDQGVLESGGLRQTKLALSSGKGKALVIS